MDIFCQVESTNFPIDIQRVHMLKSSQMLSTDYSKKSADSFNIHKETKMKIKKLLPTILIIVLLFSFFGCLKKQQTGAPEEDSQAPAKTEESELTTTEKTEPETVTESEQTEEVEKVAVVTTNKGDIVIELYPDSSPKTVANFKELIGKKFYDGLTFHRYVPAFVIQGGRGKYGQAKTIPGEFQDPELQAKMHKHDTGTVAMARADDPDSATSQFYICLAPQPKLDGLYTTFGQVIIGMDVVHQLRKDDFMRKVRLVDKSKYTGE